MKSVITRGLMLAILGLSLGGTAPAWANLQLYSYPNDSQTFVGMYERNNDNSEAIPFTAQIFSSGSNECIRLDMLEAIDRDGKVAPLEIVLVSPGGRVWFDEKSGSNGLPRVEAITNIRGWYTLHVSDRVGGGQAAIFKLKSARYSPNSSQCDHPTPLQTLGDPFNW
jgi:hypothetical protein